jgi:hypothetical protein
VSHREVISDQCVSFGLSTEYRIFEYVRVLFYADDIKLVFPVKNFQECMKIQSDLNKLYEWARVIHYSSTSIDAKRYHSRKHAIV